MKNKRLLKYLPRVCVVLVLVLGLLFVSGCGKSEKTEGNVKETEISDYKVKTVTDEKYICALYPLVAEEMENTIARIKCLKNESIDYTAEYVENLSSFCFLVKDCGMYKVTVEKSDTVLSEHIVDVNEQNSFYLLYMPGVESGK